MVSTRRSNNCSFIRLSLLLFEENYLLAQIWSHGWRYVHLVLIIAISRHLSRSLLLLNNLMMLGISRAPTTALLKLDHWLMLLDVHALIRWTSARASHTVAIPTVWLATHENLTLAHYAIGLTAVIVLEVMGRRGWADFVTCACFVIVIFSEILSFRSRWLICSFIQTGCHCSTMWRMLLLYQESLRLILIFTIISIFITITGIIAVICSSILLLLLLQIVEKLCLVRLLHHFQCGRYIIKSLTTTVLLRYEFRFCCRWIRRWHLFAVCTLATVRCVNHVGGALHNVTVRLWSINLTNLLGWVEGAPWISIALLLLLLLWLLWICGRISLHLLLCIRYLSFPVWMQVQRVSSRWPMLLASHDQISCLLLILGTTSSCCSNLRLLGV